MIFEPYEHYTLSSSLPPEALDAALRERIPSLWSREALWPLHLNFIASFGKDAVTFYPYNLGSQNSARAELVCRLEPAGEGAAVEVTAKMRPCVVFFLYGWFASLFCMLIFAVRVRNWAALMCVVMLAAGIGMVKLMRFLAVKELPVIRERLARVIREIEASQSVVSETGE